MGRDRPRARLAGGRPGVRAQAPAARSPAPAAADAFAATLEDYVAALAAHGLACVPTTLRRVAGRRRGVDRLDRPAAAARRTRSAPELLRGGDPAAGHPVLDAVLDADLTIPGPRLALDGQLSNFALVDGRLLYLDVTTPLLFDAAGRLRMDIGLQLAALPAVLRPAVRRWVVPDLLRRYRDPRSVVLDLLGNLLKERLDAWVPVALERVGGRLVPGRSPQDEVRKVYALRRAALGGAAAPAAAGPRLAAPGAPARVPVPAPRADRALSGILRR